MNLGQIPRDQTLQSIRFGDQSAQLLLVFRHDIGFHRLVVAEPIPVTGFERLLDTRENIGDRFESDGYSPVSAAMCAHASRNSLRLLLTNGNAAASLLRLASVSFSKQNA